MRAIYFVQVERLNNTGITTINTMMTPITVIQSVDPACEASMEAVGVEVRFRDCCAARLTRDGCKRRRGQSQQ